MEKAGRILKSDDVKLEGRFCLDAGKGASYSENGRNAGSISAEARIIESQPEFAVIEVTCSCGAKTHIRCEYANA